MSGRVQGVFFRETTRQTAQAADVAGWVRNLTDGTLEWTDPDGGYRVVGLWPGPWHASLDGEGGLEFPLAKARVAGSAEHRLDLRPAPPR